MSRFAIRFNPDLPKAAELLEWPNIANLDVAAIQNQHPGDFDIIYQVGNTEFSYYPSSILTILNDLDLERSMIKERERHYMTLSGYTVLEMDFEGDRAIFLDPSATSRNGEKPVVGESTVAEVETAFRDAMARALRLIA